MLSFAALSETAIAESTTVLDASAFMAGAVATASAGTLGYDAKASITNPAATGNTTAGTLGYDAQSTTTLPSATATTSAGTVEANPNEDLDSVSASTSAGTLSYDAKASIVLPAATSATSAGTLGFDAKANITLDAATADADLTANDFTDEDAQASATVSGVSAATTANWDTVNGIYAVQVVFAATDFERKRCVNIVPYGNYKVYVTR